MNTLRFRFAKTGRPGLGGGRAEKAAPLSFVPENPGAVRTMRTFVGNVDVVGVAGSTLTEEVCGLLPVIFRFADAVGEAIDVVVEDVDDALV